MSFIRLYHEGLTPDEIKKCNGLPFALAVIIGAVIGMIAGAAIGFAVGSVPGAIIGGVAGLVVGGGIAGVSSTM